MKLKLPLLGTIQTGKDTEPETKIVEKKVSEADILGGFLNFGSSALSGEKTISTKLIKANEEWVYINVSTLAETVSSLEFELLQFKMIDGQIELEPIEEHELLDLLERFNEVTTKTDAIYNTEAHLDLTGDAFWFLEGGANKKKPEKIYLLQPDAVSLKLGDFTKAGSVLVSSYEYKLNVNNKTVEESYRPDEIVHIKVPNPANPYRGRSAVEALATTIDTDNFAQEALKNLFKNGMIGDFFLSTEKRQTPEQIKNLAAQFRAAYTGVKNFWKVPILTGGIIPQKLMSTGREMQLIELEEWFRNKIMAAFKNTRASIGLDDEVNRASAEASLINWKRSVIAPKMGRIVNALNEFLVPRYGDNLILGFKDPVPEDRESEIKEAVDLFTAKIITKNEARQILDYEAVEGGDEFEVTVNPLAQNFDEDVKSKLPSLKYVNYQKVFRKAGIYSEAKAYAKALKEARPLAEKIVKSHRKKEEVIEQPREHAKFTNEQVWAYWQKQINVVEHTEEIFHNVAEQFSREIVEQGLNNITESKIEVDKEELLDRAVNKFTPSLNEVLILSGQLANSLLKIDEPYIPTKAINTREALKAQILLFAESMVDTDVDLMAEELAVGLDDGKSIAEIRRAIQDKFDDYTKTQAERITRTEVLKVSNLGTQDAFEQSGVVEGKQWLTAMDDRVDGECDEMNGQIVGLSENYDSTIKNLLGEDKAASILSYDSVDYPPLHPNCRCTLLPIIEGQEDFDIRSYTKFQDLQLKIKELEDKADKRTKTYKEWKEKYAQSEQSKTELEEYVKELEKIAGIGNEK